MGIKSIEMANLNNLSTYLDTFQQQLKDSHYNNLPEELIIQIVAHKRSKFVLNFDSDTISTCDTSAPQSPTSNSPAIDIDVLQVTMRIQDFWKFALPDNKKGPPPLAWNQAHNHTRRQPRNYKGQLTKNYGIPTGPRNMIIVVDVDTKDEGIEEFNKYILEFGPLNTFTVQSWSGGYHYFFNYDPNNYKMVNYLTNSSGYRGKGLDIRTKGGFIIGPGSVVNGQEYKVINQAPIMDMPDTLIDWLTESRTRPDKPKRPSNRHNEINTQVSTDIKYIVRDNELDNILNLLPSKFLHNYSDWISVLTASWSV